MQWLLLALSLLMGGYLFASLLWPERF
ncbi:K(+)-transporting ATPase subunit F [Halomonas binhaiensis]|uniref:K(+)-transporting ATPase subunit F n=1 Tax=Halomonas binhaiensis TaxID=2562282 RepID=A0A5C1NN24_9GAMM|nr:K(+)-transporting ATPase subunit F [Halomonas binhaiensis]